jgi:hypothetical protein
VRADFAISRLNRDGSPDLMFGNSYVDFAGGADQAWAAALQANGKLVVAGHRRARGRPT